MVSIENLEEIRKFFIELIAREGLDQNGEINIQGKCWDDIAGEINRILIKKSVN